MGLEFWKNEFIREFELNDVGKNLLDLTISIDQEKALNHILHEFKKLYREEIIEFYCEEYQEEAINSILHDLGEKNLTKMEIENFKIKGGK